MTGFAPLVRGIVRERSAGVPRRGEECWIDGCVKQVHYGGHCAMHAARIKKYGVPDLPERITYEFCTVDGCERKTRSSGSPYCEMHYYRLRRTGSTADPQWISGQCLVEGCKAKAAHSGTSAKLGTFTEGYCRKHALRLRNRGDVTFVNRGENHYAWTGEQPTYECAHQRVKSQRGVPSNYTCVDCGKPAKHWSYDHSDPSELFQEGKGPYSPDVNRYHPRCVKCHKRFDLARFK